MRALVGVSIVLLGVGLLAMGRVVWSSAGPSLSGTITIDNASPHYGDTVTLTYHVTHRYRQMTGALLCSQSGHYVEIDETPLDSKFFDGTYADTIADPVPSNLPPFDRTQPAHCIAYVFREPQSANASGAILTNVLSFGVMP